MALNSFKCNYQTPLHFKGLIRYNQQTANKTVPSVICITT